MTESFEQAVVSAAAELFADVKDISPPHVHFSARMFDGLVPEFTDVAWLELAPRAANAVAQLGGEFPFVISIPIGEWERIPDPFEPEALIELAPWEPPAIYLLNHGSAREIRSRDGFWHRDVGSLATGAFGWFGGHLLDEPPQRWRVSLYYETPSAG